MTEAFADFWARRGKFFYQKITTTNEYVALDFGFTARTVEISIEAGAPEQIEVSGDGTELMREIEEAEGGYVFEDIRIGGVFVKSVNGGVEVKVTAWPEEG